MLTSSRFITYFGTRACLVTSPGGFIPFARFDLALVHNLVIFFSLDFPKNELILTLLLLLSYVKPLRVCKRRATSKFLGRLCNPRRIRN